MTEVVRKNVEGFGEDCISCCPVNLECDCDAVSAVYNFVTFMFNQNADSHTQLTSTEIAACSQKLLGFAVMGTIEQKLDANGDPDVDYGRTLVRSLLDTWLLDASWLQTDFQELHRVINPFARSYLAQECMCNDDFTQTDNAKLVANLLYVIESFAYIGMQGYPANMEEWAQGGICGTCYKDCQGNDFIFSK